MASSQTSAMRSLHRLALSSRSQTRQLHITGPTSHPVRIAASEKSAFGLPSVSKSETEGSARTFSTSDSAYDSPHALQTIAFREQFTVTPAPTSTPFSPTSQKTRQFNTTRQLKRVGDSSTIDFAYLPSMPEPTPDYVGSQIRVPLIPADFVPRREEVIAPTVSEVLEEYMPSISTAAADGTHLSSPSAMSDVHDGGGHLLDFHEMAETLTGAAKKVTLGTDREASEEVTHAKGLGKQIWTGLLADVFGSKPARA